MPRDAMLFFALAPPVLALLFEPNGELTLRSAGGAVVAIAIYTSVVGVCVHLAFESLESRMLARGLPLPARVPLHAALTALLVSVLTFALTPLLSPICSGVAGHEVSILWRGVIVSYAYLGVASFVAHLQRQAVRERMRAHEERVAALEARLHALQAQTRPHFLFNSLNVIAGLVHERPDEAERMVERLAELLRYTLETAEKRLVPLADEMAIIRDYLEIQRARFGERLEVAVVLPEGIGECGVPPMLVQPLVENAVLHGVGGMERGGRVRVAASVVRGRLEVRVEDDGVGPGASERRGTGTGLRTVIERLAIAFGEEASFEMSAAEPRGTLCVVTLPEVRQW